MGLHPLTSWSLPGMLHRGSEGFFQESRLQLNVPVSPASRLRSREGVTEAPLAGSPRLWLEVFTTSDVREWRDNS